MADEVYFSLKEIIGQRQWPLADLAPEVTEHIWVSNTWFDAATQTGHIGVLLEQDVSLRIPGIDHVSISLGSAVGVTEFVLSASFNPFSIGVRIPVVLHVNAEVLRPIKPGTLKEPDLEAKTLNIPLAAVDLGITATGEPRLSIVGTVQLPRCMIGTSGVIIEGGGLAWLAAGDPAPQGAVDPPPGFTGLYISNLSVQLPEFSQGVARVTLRDCYLGTGGFSGNISLEDAALAWHETQKTYTGLAAGELFGFKAGLRKIEIKFERNVLTRGTILAEMFLPYLDKRIGLELSLSANGDFGVALAGPQTTNPDTGVSMTGALMTVEKAGVMRLKLISLGFVRSGDDAMLVLSGSVRPLFPGMEWPEMGVKQMALHVDGRFDLGGGWIELPQQKGAKLKGFPLEVRKIGFGTEDGKRWVGFSGGLKLVDGLPIGGSVEGLKLRWDPNDPAQFDIELKGVELALNIPDVLKLKGKVAFFDEQGKQWFQGSAKVDLIALNCSLDAQVLVGRTPTYSFFYIFLEAGLPAGIPLFQTGLAIYGLGGLFGYNVRPDRHEGETWYEGWYKRLPEGPTDASKWTNEEHRLVFGATLTIGTLPDNGTSVNARVLVIVMVPGPLVLIEGKANLITDRKAIRNSEPMFKALAVIDGEAGTFLLNVEPHVVYPRTPAASKGSVLDLSGMAEAFFDFNHSDRWYLNVGVKEPREKRIRAKLLRLFNANAYFMLNSQRLALGAYVGIDERFTYGPVSLRYGVWFETDAELVFRPLQLTADAGLHGRAEIKVFGVGLGVELDAIAHVTTPKPFEFTAELRAKADLPWPLPDPEVRIPFAIRDPQPPVMTVPLQTVDLISLKGPEFWDTGTETESPLVPLDGKPAVVFAKSVDDVAGIGGNRRAVGSERVGGSVFSYRLESIRLQKQVRGEWVVAAESPSTGTSTPPLRGMWVPMSAQGDAPPVTKLVLGVRSPFDGHQGVLSNSAAEEFAERYSGYPGHFHTRDFDGLGLEQVVFGNLSTPFALDGLLYDTGILWANAGTQGVRVVDKANPQIALAGSPWPHRQALWLPARTGPQVSNPGGDPAPAPTGRRALRITFPAALLPAGGVLEQVRLQLTTFGSLGSVLAYDDNGNQLASQAFRGAVTPYTEPRHPEVILTAPGIRHVDIFGDATALFAVRFLVVGGSSQAGVTNAENRQRTEQQWSGEELLLEPGTTYRLQVTTSVDVVRDSPDTPLPQELDAGRLVPAALPAPTTAGNAQRYSFVQDVHFCTQGPPGFVEQEIDRNVAAQKATLPEGTGAPKPAASLARSLTSYVARTLPADGGERVYRSYDLFVHFNEPYIRRMYAGFGARTLALSLTDRNGAPVRERTGGTVNAPQWTDATLTSRWLKERDPVLTRAEQQWANLLQDSEWLSLSPDDVPRNDVLCVSASGPAMQPRMTYLATLSAQPDTGMVDRDLYRFSFTTSRFASFADHMHSFSGRVWDSGQGRASPLAALGAAQSAALEAAAERGAVEDFSTIARLFDLGERPLPDKVEITVLRDAAKRWGFLVESPEPIDRARTQATLQWKAQPAEPAVHRGTIRLRDARFGDRATTDYGAEWVELLVTETTDLDGCALQHLQAAGGADEYQTLYAFSGTRFAHAGTIVRVHAGATPATPPADDGIVHVYAAASPAQAGWLLHAAGDTLRIRDRQGAISSIQGVLPQWADQDARWVWNAEGTRAFVFTKPKAVGCSIFFVAQLPAWLQQLLQSIVVQPPLSAATGSYRILWSYALDAPGLPPLSRGGQQVAEEAILQFTLL